MDVKLPDPVLQAIRKMERAGYETVAVGGCVRDRLMGRTPLDYDLATAALPQDVARVFSGETVVATGLQHGTMTVVLGGMALQITTFRVDGKYLDARRPEGVAFTQSLYRDLQRRDFTINAIAYAPGRGLIDPMQGRRDIGRRLIRTVGDPDLRFGEDALRILRALRFSSQLSFAIEPETAGAARALSGRLALIARERIGAEIAALVMGDAAPRTLRAHRPVLEAAIGGLRAVEDGRYAQAAEAVGRAPRSKAARLAAFLAPLGDGAPAALASLRPDGKTRRRALALIDWINGPKDAWLAARALGDLGAEDARALFNILGADARALEALIEGGACVSIGQLAVNGADVQALGRSGPAVGEALRQILDAVIRGELPNERAALLAEIRTLL
jgi:tRNA nucleotidyltransferase (CCA-adding enzyme)